MNYNDNLLEALDFINPSALSYQEWLNVGMGLHEAGYPVSAWDDWSRRDPGRYHTGECARKWNGFHGTERPITGRTIAQMAISRGWSPARSDGHELGWDDEIQVECIYNTDNPVIVNTRWIEGCEIEEPEKWEPAKQLSTYLEILFDSTDFVGYVTRSFPKNNKPTPGAFDQTAGQILENLERYGNDLGKTVGDYNPEVGAWIRFNPLDGKGIKDANVTDYRYALVESDKIPVEKQNVIIRKLELPVACLVYSGDKSLHAIVRINATSIEEYWKRVDYLYTVCQKNGLEPDMNNRNPSRLSRMPGVMRNGQKQFIVDTNIGKANFTEWRDWIEKVTDDLPDPEDLIDVWNALPELSPVLIDGVLRQGHKMLLAGPSKAGKSFLQIELVISIAEGRPWLGFNCAQGRVLYVNLELDRASCLHRFRDVYEKLGWKPENIDNITIWNLRGKSTPMNKLAPKLIRRALKKNYIAVVIDPIYKVITGDENSADQMAAFCNEFDKICTELGCAVIYCHHHSKGQQGSKRSMDRASGSGVFARDPDALLDLIELKISDELREQMENNVVCQACGAALKAEEKSDEVSQDALCNQREAVAACEKLLSKQRYTCLLKELDAVRRDVAAYTAWRIEGTLREFPKFPPLNIWFKFPLHMLDNTGVLEDIQLETEAPSQQRGGGGKKKPGDKQKERFNALETAYEACNMGNGVTIADLVNYMAKGKQTVRNYIDEHPGFKRENGFIVRLSEGSKK